MLEFTGLDSVLWSVGVLYWLLAGAAIALALWKGRGWQRKALWATAAVAVFGFLPGKLLIEKLRHDAYAREAWAYFKKKCETEAGEKIYKTFTGVKSVLVIKPLPPATEEDLYDQFWYGDPYSYSAHQDRSEGAARVLVGNDLPTIDGRLGKGFDFVDIKESMAGQARFRRISMPPGSTTRVITTVEQSQHRFGISWEDISTIDDRRYWVAGSRLRIVDLTSDSVVGERVGYFIEAGFGSTDGQRRPWLTSKGPNTTCPRAHDWADRIFVLKVLRPGEGGHDGK